MSKQRERESELVCLYVWVSVNTSVHTPGQTSLLRHTWTWPLQDICSVLSMHLRSLRLGVSHPLGKHALFIQPAVPESPGCFMCVQELIKLNILRLAFLLIMDCYKKCSAEKCWWWKSHFHMDHTGSPPCPEGLKGVCLIFKIFNADVFKINTSAFSAVVVFNLNCVKNEVRCIMNSMVTGF